MKPPQAEATKVLAANPTHAGQMVWQIVPEGVYQLQSAGTGGLRAWSDEGGAFTANNWAISLEITNLSADIQFRRLLWKQP